MANKRKLDVLDFATYVVLGVLVLVVVADIALKLIKVEYEIPPVATGAVTVALGYLFATRQIRNGKDQ